MTRTLAALVVVALTAAPALARNDAPPEMAPADVDRWLAFFDKLVATVQTETGPCEKMAARVDAVIDANRDAVAIARAAHQQGKKLPKHAQAHMMEGVKKMVPAMERCGQHRKVREAFARLDLTRKDAAARRR